ncbi:hypothetical protein FHW12_000329 [Dokdonella fugitiva]|uniref:Uncharacterized protein n=1 Tax=Dokdonella fugitiva TaxID=328517 RepID=A0A839EY70_9GAMM|nr:hypothetical protein [Dokdonella fugitiva]MBA8886138.1 hypothetical protein [Dokdonella fugitiva]
MKDTTARAKAMTDAQLRDGIRQLAHEVKAKHAALDAMRKEWNRRARTTNAINLVEKPQ